MVPASQVSCEAQQAVYQDAKNGAWCKHFKMRTMTITHGCHHAFLRLALGSYYRWGKKNTMEVKFGKPMPFVVPHQINYMTKILCELQTTIAYKYQRRGKKSFL